MKCRKCGAEMHLVKQEYFTKRSYDDYWECPNCSSGCLESVIDLKPFAHYWAIEKNDKSIYYIIEFVHQ